MRADTKRTVGGLVIAYSKGSKAADKVAAALQLIQDVDPLRYRRMVLDLKQIWITTIPGAAGQFVRSTLTCELDERFVMREDISVAEVANAIVHEAAHARIDRCGIGYEEELRSRIEEVCMRRELAFAARLPDGERIHRWVEARRNGSVDYSNTGFNTREMAGIRDALIHLGTPVWLADRMIAFGRWRRRRSKRH